MSVKSKKNKAKSTERKKNKVRCFVENEGLRLILIALRIFCIRVLMVSK
jgi:hypothetical protein